MPETQVRLSAGRMNMSPEGQACAFTLVQILFCRRQIVASNPDVNEI
jgi:biotin synthase